MEHDRRDNLADEVSRRLMAEWPLFEPVIVPFHGLAIGPVRAHPDGTRPSDHPQPRLRLILAVFFGVPTPL